MVFSLDRGRKANMLTGLGQERWCTDWAWVKEMVYSLAIGTMVVYRLNVE